MSDESRIRVTHILTKPELGGAQANTLYTVRHLDRRRFAPALVTSPNGPLAAEMASLEDTQVTFVPVSVFSKVQIPVATVPSKSRVFVMLWGASTSMIVKLPTPESSEVQL